MNKFACTLMILGLSVYAVGCGGKKSDSADGTTDKPATDTPATDTPATDTPATDTPTTDDPSSDTGVKVKGGDPVDPSTILGTDNPPTTDATNKTTDIAPKADDTKKAAVPPPLDDGLEVPAPNIDNPFKSPDDSTKKKDGDGNKTKDG